MSCYIRNTVLFLKRKIKWTIKIITGQLKRNNNDNNDDDYDGAETSKPFPRASVSKVKCSAFDMEMIFHFHANKTHFQKKGCGLGLILKVRVFGTRKWPFVDLKHFRHPSDEQLRLIDTLYFKQQQFAICPL